jgi:hypothetical protein
MLGSGKERAVTGKAIRQYQMLVRVSEFGAAHAASFPQHTVAAQTFAEVRDAASALAQYAVAQASARSRGSVQPKAAARTRLRQSLRLMSRTARALALDMPGLAHGFRVPRTNGNRALLIAARGFAREAADVADAFSEYGLPSTFLSDLDAEIAALELATDDYESLKSAGVAATALVDVVRARGLASVRRLDAIVANVFRHDAPMMAAWQETRRVGPTRRSAGLDATAAPAPLRLVTNVA